MSTLPLALAGFALLAMAMHRHAAPVGFGGWSDQRRSGLRGAGWGMLALSLLPCLLGARWRIGVVEWVGELTLAAAIVAVILTYRPRALPPVVATLLVVSVLSAAYQAA